MGRRPEPPLCRFPLRRPMPLLRKWDELCVLSGIRPGGGCHHLLNAEQLEDVASAMASEVQDLIRTSRETPRLAKCELESIIREALAIAIAGDGPNPKLLRNHVSTWPGSQTCIAIGHFNARGDSPRSHDSEDYRPGNLIKSGDNVEVEAVKSGECGEFRVVVVRPPDGEPLHMRRRLSCSCSMTSSLGNVFILEGCWMYLQAWLDVSLPSRSSSRSSAPLSLPSELYEILNSRVQRRRHISPAIGSLPDVEYGGIEKTCHQFQDTFLSARSGSVHVARAIGDGVRGEDLFDALRMDFGCWMAVRPDMWPSPPSSFSWRPPIYLHAKPLTSVNGLISLPTELFLQISHSLSVSELLRFACTSKSAWNAITEPYMFSQIIRDLLFDGSLRWVLPVKGAYDEVERMDVISQKWLSTYGTDPNSSHNAITPLASPSFPYYPFLRECYNSDSMMNRRRLWGIIKQFDGIWMRYRLEGWERDVFCV